MKSIGVLERQISQYFHLKKMVSTENLGLIVRTSPIGQGLEQSSRLKSA